MQNSLMNRLAELATISDTPGALTRLFLSPAHQRAITLISAWMQDAGLETHVDAIGNLVGRTPNAAGKPTLLLGSHIDTVRDAGAYDGNFGVLAAIAAVKSLPPGLPYAIEIIAFGDEEGSRFPKTLSGSRAFGCNPEAIEQIARDPAEILAYLELHIEQGPVLEGANLPVGIVTAINGASRLSVTLTGTAGHAGTIPMSMRRDALAAAAEQILFIQRHATAIPNLVATVGAIAIHPGAPNSVPGRATYSIDIRAPEDAVRAQTVAAITGRLREIAASRDIEITLTQTHDAPATQCAPWLQAQLAGAVAAQNLPIFHLPSGAGHDAMAIAALCPVAMLFVRCKGGISHTPEESITAEDADIAVAVLLEFLRNFAKPEAP
jgi:acetylornithine deacetylase/succinyl-diaminopimelate desuccinylase-like protein